MVAVMIYAGMDGKPMPSTIDASIVRNKVQNKEPAPNAVMADVMTVPKLVRLTTPMMIPTTAQAIMTESDWRAPFSSASRISRTPMRVDLRNAATTTVRTIV